MKKHLLLLLVFGLSLFAQVIYSQVPSYLPSNGLVGYWPFNGNANDQSGNALNGTVTGATLVPDRNGNSNSAYSFNGTSDFIQTASNTLLNLSQTFSISAWYKINNISSSNGYLISRPGDTNGTLNGYSIIYHPSGGSDLFDVVGYWTATNHFNCSTSNNNSLDDTNWHHIVFTKPMGNPMNIYIDGIIKSGGSSGSITGLFTSTQPLFFGKGPSSGSLGSTFFNGILDDIGIWNRELTIQEVTQLFNNQLSINTNIYDNEFTIAPNPVKDYLTVNKGNSLGKDLKLIIYNLLGQEVQTNLLNDSLNETITISEKLNAGIYIAQIRNSTELLQNIKILIK